MVVAFKGGALPNMLVPTRKALGSIRGVGSAVERCRRLHASSVLSRQALDAATSILSDRNNFHHLNKDVEQDFQALEGRGAECVNLLHLLESEIFAYSVAAESPGQVVLSKPEYWPSPALGQAQVHLRQLG